MNASADPAPSERSPEPGPSDSIADPMANAAPRDFSAEASLGTLADRTRYLSHGSFVAAVAGAVLAAFGLAGRVELGALLYLVPVAALNALIGVLLRRAAQSLAKSATDRAAFAHASTELARVFTLQLVAAAFFVLLVFASLASALMVKNVTEL
jgi:hypothetical protein